jgi:Tfp pilus assembly protein PilO
MKNSKLKKTNKKVDYRVISFILFTVSFFVVFAIKPSISLIYTLQKEKTEYEKIDQVLEEKIQQIIMTQAQFMELINNKELVEQALPNTHQIEKTKAFLVQKPIINTYNIGKIQVMPAPNPELNTVIININGNGSYSDLLEFINYINSSRRLVSMDYFTINSSDSGTESATLNFNSVLNTYYYVDI